MESIILLIFLLIRRKISIDISNYDPWLSIYLQDSRNFKKTLLGLERLYNIIIDVEDCEKKLAVLPTGIPLRSQVETDGKEGIRNLGGQLVREDKIKLYIAVRKGKSLLIRALRWLNTSQMRIGKPSFKSQLLHHRLQGQC